MASIFWAILSRYVGRSLVTATSWVNSIQAAAASSAAKPKITRTAASGRGSRSLSSQLTTGANRKANRTANASGRNRTLARNRIAMATTATTTNHSRDRTRAVLEPFISRLLGDACALRSCHGRRRAARRVKAPPEWLTHALLRSCLLGTAQMLGCTADTIRPWGASFPVPWVPAPLTPPFALARVDCDWPVHARG